MLVTYGFPIFPLYKQKHKINAHHHTEIHKKGCVERPRYAAQLRLLSCNYNTNIKKQP